MFLLRRFSHHHHLHLRLHRSLLTIANTKSEIKFSTHLPHASQLDDSTTTTTTSTAAVAAIDAADDDSDLKERHQVKEKKEKKKKGKKTSTRAFRTVHNMRPQFDSFPNVQHINWFPGHMAKTQRQMVDQILRNKHYKFDVLVEVRDARIPFTSSAIFEPDNMHRHQQQKEENMFEMDEDLNATAVDADADADTDAANDVENKASDISQANAFFRELKLRERHIKRLIVFNKSDLADPQQIARIRRYYQEQREQLAERVRAGRTGASGDWSPGRLYVETEVVFTSCQSGADIGPSSVKKIVEMCLKMAQRRSIYDTSNSAETPSARFKTIPFVFMIVGIPNVGKSSIINALRQQFRVDQKKKAREGALPGVTRHISAFTVCEKPHPCMVIDTPGVLMPTIQTSEQAYKLALSAAVKMLSQKKSTLSSIHEDALCDYLLFKMNQQRKFKYVEQCGLEQPTDSIDEVLSALTRKLHALNSTSTSAHKEKDHSAIALDDESSDLDQLLAARMVNTSGTVQAKEETFRDSQRNTPLWNRVASHFVKLYQNGELGRITLDTVPDQ